MVTKHRNRRMLFVTVILFLLMFSCMSVRAEAGWKKNSNGTYSYYLKGKKVKKKWIKEGSKSYYVNSKGVRQTGWLYKGKKWYYFKKTGVLVKNKWIKYKNNMYYAGSNGAVYANGMKKAPNGYTYAFDKRGAVQKGRLTYNKKIYYFESKHGRMVKNKWVKTNGKYYYYGADGAMVKNKWIGRYYVGKTGLRLKNTWKDDCYLGSNAKACIGLQKIGTDYYYFDPKTYKKTVNVKLTVEGKTYQFDGNGIGTEVSENGAPKPTVGVKVHNEYFTDPLTDDETLLATIIYCESGNQSYTGKVAVGLVLLNRLYSPLFPDVLREVVYQDMQFAPARDGSLTRALKNPALVDPESKKAARTVIARFEACRAAGTDIYLQLDGKKKPFDCLFFMTLPAYTSLGLVSEYQKIGDHVFFEVWKR